MKSSDKKKKPILKNDSNPEELTRLNKLIAGSGICSRREADKLIADGLIKVNGKIVTELGTKISKNDTVLYKEKEIGFEKPVYVLLNKPKGILTTASDEFDRKTVLDFFKGKINERIYPVGRLDKDTTGVLLLTNDGDLTKKLTHPSFNKKKIYHVFLDKVITREDFDKLLNGIELEDGIMMFDDLQFPDESNKKELGVEIHSGKNRIIRRMFEAMGYKILKLDRVYFAGLTKKDLKRGKWRFLSQIEISNLKRGTYE